MNKSLNYRWETEEGKTLRFMKIPPIKKLEWLQQIHVLFSKHTSNKLKRKIRRVRELR